MWAITMRDGVRNYQARNNLQAMKAGDQVFRYHSNEGKEIVGIAEVAKEAYPDPTHHDDTRVVVDLIPLSPLSKPVTLATIKSDPKLSEIALLKQQRLSVCSIRKEEFDYILSISLD
jgi:predicted RNA-binding protein with PUA-like domain